MNPRLLGLFVGAHAAWIDGGWRQERFVLALADSLGVRCHVRQWLQPASLAPERRAPGGDVGAPPAADATTTSAEPFFVSANDADKFVDDASDHADKGKRGDGFTENNVKQPRLSQTCYV